jgi:hypothetical protein
MAADVVVIPTIMAIGFTGQFNGTSAADAGAGTAKRIFGPTGAEPPAAGSRGWIGTAAVRDTPGDANEGFPRTAGQVLAGAITDPGAKEAYQVAVDAAQQFYTGMVG